MYASFLRISDALNLGIFHQPPKYPVLRQAPRIEQIVLFDQRAINEVFGWCNINEGSMRVQPKSSWNKKLFR
jgi:hypothetical protein